MPAVKISDLVLQNRARLKRIEELFKQLDDRLQCLEAWAAGGEEGQEPGKEGPELLPPEEGGEFVDYEDPD